MLNLALKLLQNVLVGSKAISDLSPKSQENKPVAISINAYFTDPKTGEDRRVKYGADYTPEILSNATALLEKVNALLADLGVISVTLNSGWRPVAYNASIGGAKSSAHCTGEACDLSDSTSGIKNQLVAKSELLVKHNLYMEDPAATRLWCHLQTRTIKSGNRIFKP
jgi:hypothetical protein